LIRKWEDATLSHFRDVTAEFSVSPQIGLEDVALASADGFRLIVNNRPDGEAPDQPGSAEIEAAARAAGLAYVHVPVSGPPTREQIEAEREAVAAAGGPTLAFCRSGSRSILTWALGQWLSGAASRPELINQAAAAGYDLSAALPTG
jgi:uncharacterized protein (TIGR01244 family)